MLSDWVETEGEQQFRSFATNSKLDLGYDFDYAILTH